MGRCVFLFASSLASMFIFSRVVQQNFPENFSSPCWDTESEAILFTKFCVPILARAETNSCSQKIRFLIPNTPIFADWIE